MIDYNKKNEDKIMIPQWRYAELLKIEGNVDVFLYLMDAKLVYVANEDQAHIHKILNRGRQFLPFQPSDDANIALDTGYQE